MTVDLVIVISKYCTDGTFDYEGTSQEFHDFITGTKSQKAAEIFAVDDPNGCQFLKLSKNNIIYYIFCGSHRRGIRSATDCIVSAVKKIRKKLENVPVKCFLHHDDFYSERIKKEVPGVETYEFHIDKIQGISSLTITDIVNWLMGEKDARPLAPKDFFFDERVIENIVETLQPLHLALHAFFGISLNEENKEWKNLPDKRRDEIKKNYPDLFSEEKRQQAFLLVKEAGYDFFAEIGSRLGPSGNFDQNAPLEEQPLLTLIEEMFKKNKDNMEKADFKDLEGNKVKGEAVNQEIKKILDEKQGNEMRTLCAILANINDDGINPTLPMDDQLSQKEAETHKKRIKTSKDILFQYENCKQWLDENQSHTKWPQYLEGDWNKPADTYNDNLVKQLHRWNDVGNGEPAKTVLGQIHAITHYLAQIQT